MIHRILTIALVACSLLACSGQADAKSPQKALKRIKSRICKEHPTSKDWSSKKQCMKALGEAGVRYLGTNDGSDTSCLEKATACYPEPKKAFDVCRIKALKGYDWSAFTSCMKNPTATPKLCFEMGLWPAKDCALQAISEERAQYTISKCVRQPDSTPKYCPAPAVKTSVPRLKAKRRKGQKCAADKIEKMLIGKGYFKTRPYNPAIKNGVNKLCVTYGDCHRAQIKLAPDGSALTEHYGVTCMSCPMNNIGGIVSGGASYGSACAGATWVNQCDHIEVRVCSQGQQRDKHLRKRIELRGGKLVMLETTREGAGATLSKGRLKGAKGQVERCPSRRFCGYR